MRVALRTRYGARLLGMAKPHAPTISRLVRRGHMASLAGITPVAVQDTPPLGVGVVCRSVEDAARAMWILRIHFYEVSSTAKHNYGAVQFFVTAAPDPLRRK